MTTTLILQVKVSVCVHAQSCLTLCCPVDCSCQAPLSLGFPRQGHWRGLPLPFPGHLPNPGIEPGSPALVSGSLQLRSGNPKVSV